MMIHYGNNDFLEAPSTQGALISTLSHIVHYSTSTVPPHPIRIIYLDVLTYQTNGYTSYDHPIRINIQV